MNKENVLTELDDSSCRNIFRYYFAHIKYKITYIKRHNVRARARACVRAHFVYLKLISETFPESEHILLMNTSGILSKTLRLVGKRRSNNFLNFVLAYCL